MENSAELLNSEFRLSDLSIVLEHEDRRPVLSTDVPDVILGRPPPEPILDRDNPDFMDDCDPFMDESSSNCTWDNTSLKIERKRLSWYYASNIVRYLGIIGLRKS